jgi:hypothetical protein
VHREELMSITETIEEVKDQICEDYCRYPREWDEEEHDGLELYDSDICANCPLNRL